MNFAVPNFETGDRGTRKLNERFLLDTRLGSSRGILLYSAGVRHAMEMLMGLDDRKTFVNIATILAFAEMQRGGCTRIRPIGLSDINALNSFLEEL